MKITDANLKQVIIEDAEGKQTTLTAEDSFLVMMDNPEHVTTLACCQLHHLVRFLQHLTKIVKEEINKL